MSDPANQTEELITLEQAKFQLRVVHNREDAHIRLLIKAALKSIQNYIDRPLADVLEEGKLPEDLVIAGLLMITDMYENRSAQVEGTILTINKSLDGYLLPYRKMGV